MIVAEHLRKTFPAKGKSKAPVVAVDDVGFEARNGEITGLLGPNGAGKTTTLRMLYTLMQPESGRVLVDGKDVATDKAEQESAGERGDEDAASEPERDPGRKQRGGNRQDLQPVRLDEPRVQPDPGACHGGRSRRIQQTATRNERHA